MYGKYVCNNFVFKQRKVMHSDNLQVFNHLNFENWKNNVVVVKSLASQQMRGLR